MKKKLPIFAGPEGRAKYNEHGSFFIFDGSKFFLH